jgi:phosphatidate phosphatase LPIN
MKVGDTGEAFFVFETDQDVPADLQTSPLTGPLGDDEGEEVGPALSAVLHATVIILIRY